MTRILVVDDDGFSRNLLAETLRALGHQVSAAGDAREALQILAKQAHDGVITDVRMPGLDGIELARRIAMTPDAPPVVLMSADADFDIHEEALRRGVKPTSFLQKPFDRASVVRAANILTEGDSTAPPGTQRPVIPTVPLNKDELPEWLAAVRGNVRQVPPARLWFVAWRRQASGALEVRTPRTTTIIGLKRGQIVEVTGMPELMALKLPAGTVTDNLTAAIGGGMSMGLTLDQALATVAADVARWSLNVRLGDVRFDPEWTAGPGAIPLPGAPPGLLAAAVAEIPAEQLQRSWQSVAATRVNSRTPTDVAPDRWGLDPQSLRTHRAANGQAVQTLVYELSGGAAEKRMQALRSLDLLLRLNLIHLLA